MIYARILLTFILFNIVSAVFSEENLPPVEISTVNPVTVNIANPFYEIKTIKTEEVSVPMSRITPVAVSPPRVFMKEVETLAVSDQSKDIHLVIAHEQKLRDMFRDQRNVKNDPSLRLGSKNIEQWFRIFEDETVRNYVMDYIPLEKELRIITEVTSPQDNQEFKVLEQRLIFYSQWGYNAVLVTFDTSEQLYLIRKACDLIRSLNMKIVLAYSGGRENLNDSVFRDPDKIERFIKELAPAADAFLLGWRRTSVHLYLPDEQYVNWIIKTVRFANPYIPIIGEAYYGQTAETNYEDVHERKFSVTYNLPKNVSAVLVIGLGYPNVSCKEAFHAIFPAIKNVKNKIALVVGEKPYADTINYTGRTFIENLKIKRQLEYRLKHAGFQSVMTYSGDGSFGMYSPSITDNLCIDYKKGK